MRHSLVPDDQVLIVGGGVVGLACAYSLAEEGIEPVVLDAEVPGSGASSGNAGWIAFTPDIVAPAASPQALRTSLRWLGRRNSPLRVVPRLDPEFFRWLAGFVANCRQSSAVAGLRATLLLNAQTANLFDALERQGLGFGMERRGILVVFRRRNNWEAARRGLNGAASGSVLNRDEALASEPLLRPDACVGAVRHDVHRHVQPDRLVSVLSEHLRRRGVEIHSDTPCTGVLRSGRRVIGIETPRRTFRGRAVVLAAGTGTRSLARLAGVRVPIEAGKGYSFEMPRAALALRAPVKLYEDRLALTPFRELTRVAGVMEIGARATTVRPGAIAMMNRSGMGAFRSWLAVDARQAWAGLRPMTPDGLPIIGAVDGMENLFVAGGHGLLGLTLSLKTGSAIAACIRGGRADDPELQPFAPSRFSRARLGRRQYSPRAK